MKVLVPVDFSECTSKVIDAAVGFARKLDAELYLLHVTPPAIDKMRYSMGNSDYASLGIPGAEYGGFIRYDVLRDQIAAELKAERSELLSLKHSIPDDIKTRAILIQGDTVEGILMEADEIGAELIILGTHGHGVVHNVILGSISESVIRASTHPVMVIPQRV